MNDAASRFYERNFERITHTHDADSFVTSMKAGHGRYSAPYEYLLSHPDKDVLELGCGHPSVPKTISPMTKSYTVIDIVEGRFADLAAQNVKTIKANLDEDFPVETGAFDVVLAMMVVEHLYDPFHSFAELARVVKPGGKIFMNLPNIASIRCRLDLLRGKLPYTSVPNWFANREWDGNHLHYFTVDTVEQIANSVGLELTGLRPVGDKLWLKKLRPQLFCHEITFELEKPATS